VIWGCISCNSPTQNNIDEIPQGSSNIELDSDISDVTDEINWDEETEQLYENGDDLLVKTNDFVKSILDDVFKIEHTLVATQVTDADGVHENIELVTTKLRGKYASIPLSRCFLSQYEDIAVLAFEIFLSKQEMAYKNFLEDNVPDGQYDTYAATINTNKTKLIQVIVYNTSTKTFIGKPQGFPIEQDYWLIEGFGDAISDISIQSVKPIENGSGCAVIYEDYLVDSHHNMVIIKPVGDAILNSPLLAIGDLGGQTGCDIWAEYSNLRVNNNSVTAIKEVTCSCPEYESCADHEASDGRKSDFEVIWEW